MINLFEGLREGDLKDLVVPVISIDEYESKLDFTAVVVGFYINFKDPAKDLNRFIQKCPEELYDTDISPAPNEDGNYLVFIEFPRDEEFPEKIVRVANSLNGLTGNDSWQFRHYGSDDLFPLTSDNVEKMVTI